MNPGNPTSKINKELNWLTFNYHLLQEAESRAGTLHDDMRLVSAVARNLDIFFSCRAASLHETQNPPPTGRRKRETDGLFRLCRQIAQELDTFSLRAILPKLSNEKIIFDSQKGQLDAVLLNDRFEKIVFPALTPLVVDASHPFPRLQSRTLNLAAAIKREGKECLGLVQVPTLLPRCFQLSEKPAAFVFLEVMITQLIKRLFSDPVIEVSPFRVTREEDSSESVDGHEHRQGKAARLEIQTPVSPFIRQTLTKVLDLGERDVYLSGGPIDLTCLAVMSDYLTAHRPPLICP